MLRFNSFIPIYPKGLPRYARNDNVVNQIGRFLLFVL